MSEKVPSSQIIDRGTPLDEVLTSLRQESGISVRWGVIAGDITLTDADDGKTFLITDDAVITIDSGLSAGWSVAFIPDDSKDSTVYEVTLAFAGSGSVIGDSVSVKGVCSLALTPIADLFAAAGAIE